MRITTVSKCFINQSTDFSRHFTTDFDSWCQNSGFPDLFTRNFCNQFYHISCFCPFSILRNKNNCFFFKMIYKHNLTQKLTQIINMQHRSLIIYIWKYWKFLGKFRQYRIISFAAFSINHRRSQNYYFKVRISQFAHRYICLQFTVSIEISRFWNCNCVYDLGCSIWC